MSVFSGVFLSGINIHMYIKREMMENGSGNTKAADF